MALSPKAHQNILQLVESYKEKSNDNQVSAKFSAIRGREYFYSPSISILDNMDWGILHVYYNHTKPNGWREGTSAEFIITKDGEIVGEIKYDGDWYINPHFKLTNRKFDIIIWSNQICESIDKGVINQTLNDLFPLIKNCTTRKELDEAIELGKKLRAAHSENDIIEALKEENRVLSEKVELFEKGEVNEIISENNRLKDALAECEKEKEKYKEDFETLRNKLHSLIG